MHSDLAFYVTISTVDFRYYSNILERHVIPQMYKFSRDLIFEAFEVNWAWPRNYIGKTWLSCARSCVSLIRKSRLFLAVTGIIN